MFVFWAALYTPSILCGFMEYMLCLFIKKKKIALHHNVLWLDAILVTCSCLQLFEEVCLCAGMANNPQSSGAQVLPI